MREEIARSALYVAPMRSGSGFKSKVIEALAAGTNVVGTAYAFEFLPDPLRALFEHADTPADLAKSIVRAVSDADGNSATVVRFWQLARDEYDWAPSRNDSRAPSRFSMRGTETPRLRGGAAQVGAR